MVASAEAQDALCGHVPLADCSQPLDEAGKEILGTCDCLWVTQDAPWEVIEEATNPEYEIGYHEGYYAISAWSITPGGQRCVGPTYSPTCPDCNEIIDPLDASRADCTNRHNWRYHQGIGGTIGSQVLLSPKEIAGDCVGVNNMLGNSVCGFLTIVKKSKSCRAAPTCGQQGFPRDACHCVPGQGTCAPDEFYGTDKQSGEAAVFCVCEPGYMGRRCEQPCDCGEHGFCQANTAAIPDRSSDPAHCRCTTSGWEGPWCNIPPQPLQICQAHPGAAMDLLEGVHQCGPGAQRGSQIIPAQWDCNAMELGRLCSFVPLMLKEHERQWFKCCNNNSHSCEDGSCWIEGRECPRDFFRGQVVNVSQTAWITPAGEDNQFDRDVERGIIDSNDVGIVDQGPGRSTPHSKRLDADRFGPVGGSGGGTPEALWFPPKGKSGWWRQSMGGADLGNKLGLRLAASVPTDALTWLDNPKRQGDTMDKSGDCRGAQGNWQPYAAGVGLVRTDGTTTLYHQGREPHLRTIQQRYDGAKFENYGTACSGSGFFYSCSNEVIGWPREPQRIRHFYRPLNPVSDTIDEYTCQNVRYNDMFNTESYDCLDGLEGSPSGGEGCKADCDKYAWCQGVAVLATHDQLHRCTTTSGSDCSWSDIPTPDSFTYGEEPGACREYTLTPEQLVASRLSYLNLTVVCNFVQICISSKDFQRRRHLLDMKRERTQMGSLMWRYL